ncbi:GNAT family N-acetyltransferase [Lentisalinibacter sediminis]|uniref:GNAT family N-acetyltransferase n=1 Tax=Lentisalinibacter sediminis TaxID=2992237 RepID=UPI00386F5A59
MNSPGADDGRPVAQTPRLLLRRLREDDAGFLLRLVNEEAFRTHIGDKNLTTAEEARRFIREGAWTCQPKPGYGQFFVGSRESGEALGVCGLLYREELDVTDVGFAFLPEARGRGYAVEAAQVVLEYGRGLGIADIVALVSPHNVASIRVLEKMGFGLRQRLRLGGRETLLWGVLSDGDAGRA